MNKLHSIYHSHISSLAKSKSGGLGGLFNLACQMVMLDRFIILKSGVLSLYSPAAIVISPPVSPFLLACPHSIKLTGKPASRLKEVVFTLPCYAQWISRFNDNLISMTCRLPGERIELRHREEYRLLINAEADATRHRG